MRWAAEHDVGGGAKYDLAATPAIRHSIPTAGIQAARSPELPSPSMLGFSRLSAMIDLPLRPTLMDD